jgi:hypothetical protein
MLKNKIEKLLIIIEINLLISFENSNRKKLIIKMKKILKKL